MFDKFLSTPLDTYEKSFTQATVNSYSHHKSFFNSFMMEVFIILNQSINLQSKSVDWFLYVSDFRHERVKYAASKLQFNVKFEKILWGYLYEKRDGIKHGTVFPPPLCEDFFNLGRDNKTFWIEFCPAFFQR